MYRHCIYCSADLGGNDVLQAFPVGQTVAFDAAKARLWAICHRCARWNLAPLEERWEPVEEAEKLFRDSRLRVQSENVGLAKLPDGTQLIRVGKALPGELAAWRYGQSLTRRKLRYVGTETGLFGAVAAVSVGLAAVGLGALGGVGVRWLENRYRTQGKLRVVENVKGRAVVRLLDVQRAFLAEGEGGRLRLLLPDAEEDDRPAMVVEGDDVPRMLGRALTVVNRAGATPGRVRDAVEVLSAAASADAFVRGAARGRRVLGRDDERRDQLLSKAERLALEMALHEESERRALQGELKLLESAWREAEEIAAIADRLATSPGA